MFNKILNTENKSRRGVPASGDDEDGCSAVVPPVCVWPCLLLSFAAVPTAFSAFCLCSSVFSVLGMEELRRWRCRFSRVVLLSLFSCSVLFCVMLESGTKPKLGLVLYFLPLVFVFSPLCLLRFLSVFARLVVFPVLLPLLRFVPFSSSLSDLLRLRRRQWW